MPIPYVPAPHRSHRRMENILRNEANALPSPVLSIVPQFTIDLVSTGSPTPILAIQLLQSHFKPAAQRAIMLGLEKAGPFVWLNTRFRPRGIRRPNTPRRTRGINDRNHYRRKRRKTHQ